MNLRTKLVLAVTVAAVSFVPANAQMRRNIRIVGSSTVYPFSKAVAEKFAAANRNVPAPVVESTGTGAGAKLFCAGVGAQHPDILDASRRLKLSEFKTCNANGVSQITEVQVGLDGLSLAQATGGQLRNLSVKDVYMAIAAQPFGKPNKAKTWKDVNASLPAIPIRVYGPPTTSGTRSSIEDLLMNPVCDTNPAVAAMKKTNEARYNKICKDIREDGAYINTGENDNLIVQKLSSDPVAVGFFGYSYLEENLNRLRGISLNGVAPSYQTISSFKYPGARALYIYIKNAHLQAIPGIRQYAAQYVRDTAFGPKGYLPPLGLVASPEAERVRAQRMATSMTPINAAGLK
ncbi:substrate-binding domain-containing protein [Rhizorhapis suberifaciens]|uniref:Phosphate transport system substrate-binding protein n=1 Tax=Rhizorhapis suberifaciens TaxID=13656 RepID=A0A840HY56_9SPHN|nr:substrate-binding domain-containing protein [Rhizorhapis suberifaciens]MBB4642527.1 phosphate transport system substrate-binding protein [Rhizorhapis suberifaciens]